ncbi:MAG: hypothetical protein OEX00_11500 [Gammaproteobacteria bacterium]|nr:hypothetical protein [Gammaproteobacteria bacterium]MDH5694211.1 hypothetical protein [Gammaproteobacteria bacterium]
MIKLISKLFVSILVLLSLSCSQQANISEKIKWKDYDIFFETRPPEMKPGMMEFLVVINEKSKRPASSFLVSLRIGETGKWSQAIQDGLTGVYRRAINVRNPDKDVLFVHLKGKEDETVISFPLNKQITK